MSSNLRAFKNAQRNALARQGGNSQEKTFKREMEQARANGTLNLANRQMTELPDLLYSENDNVTEAKGFDNDSPRWWEVGDIRKIFLQCNKLKEIPCELIAKFGYALVVLDMHENELENLPIFIGDLENLQSLNLSHNRLEQLPGQIVNLQQLAEFNVSHNKLTKLVDQNWEKLQSLANLKASHNKIQKLPDTFGCSMQLRILDLSNNQIAEIPSSFNSLKMLETLDLSGNKLLKFECDNLKNLKLLKIDRNQLKSMPILNGSQQLKELSCCDNSISEIPRETLSFLEHVSILALRGNKIRDFPEEVAISMKDIERLDLANNDLSIIPAQFGLKDSLKSIVLDGNPLRSLRRDVVARGTVFIKQWLVSRLPQDKQTPQESTIPVAEVKSNGQKLDLTNCGSENMDETLGQGDANQVKDLVLAKNRLKTCPISVLNFTNLEFLDLSCNFLQQLPSELMNLKILRHLNLSNNKFNGPMPSVVYSFAKLEVLMASDNQIDTLDTDALNKLQFLSVLDIRNNNFSQLQPKISLCPSLK